MEKQNCFRMRKPEIIDENVYEIVGGTSKVIRPDLLSKTGRTALEIAANSFIKNKNVTTAYALRNPNPDKTSQTMLHQRMLRLGNGNFGSKSLTPRSAPRYRSKSQTALIEERATSAKKKLMTHTSIANGRFRDFETLKHLNMSGRNKSDFSKTAKTKSTATSKNKPIRTCQLDSMVGLSNSDMKSLKEANIFNETGSAASGSRLGTPKKYRVDNRRRYMKKIMQQNRYVEQAIKSCQPNLAKTTQW